jgi:glyoxylase-like metal-dependent hydrolase (beta-lactamase superfamily II)
MAGNARVWVVNTHFHTDHCGGNEVFLNAATIAATAATRERIGQTATTLPERIAAAEVAAIELPPSDDAESVRRRRQAVARLDVLRRLRLVAPDVTISDRVTLYGQRRRADLITVGTAHTNGDIAIYLPDDRTLVAGDVVVNRTLPWVSDGDAPLWIEALGRLRTLKAAILIPGHGNVGDARTIDEMADCLGTLVANADALAGRNGPVAARPPERFRSWREAGRWAELVRAVATSKIQAPS